MIGCILAAKWDVFQKRKVSDFSLLQHHSFLCRNTPTPCGSTLVAMLGLEWKLLLCFRRTKREAEMQRRLCSPGGEWLNSIIMSELLSLMGITDSDSSSFHVTFHSTLGNKLNVPSLCVDFLMLFKLRLHGHLTRWHFSKEKGFASVSLSQMYLVYLVRLLGQGDTIPLYPTMVSMLLMLRN